LEAQTWAKRANELEEQVKSACCVAVMRWP
jgi:hypothetical protein